MNWIVWLDDEKFGLEGDGDACSYTSGSHGAA